jgi:Tfp pilus assembly protein PilX
MTKGRWQFLYPQREEGMALVLALVTTTVVTIMVVAMLSFTSASSRDASLKDAGQSASALAEGGVNHGLAQLASHYYRDNSPNPPTPYRPDGKTPINSSAAFDPSWFTGTTTSVQSPTNGSPCTARSTCMTWTATYTPAPVGIQQGTITLTGIGTVPNPTGASAVVRRATARLGVLKHPVLVKTPDYWKEIYTGAGPSDTCDFTVDNGVEITAPLYTAGNLCLRNSSKIYGSNVTLQVFGWAWIQNPQSFIGKQSDASYPRLGAAKIRLGCSSVNNTAPSTAVGSCAVNHAGDKVWDGTPTSQHQATAPTADPLPAVNWSQAQSDQNNSSPAPSCTNGRSLSESTFSLTPATSYSCTTAVGSIVWNASTKLLTVSGNIWFSGNLWIDTTNIPTRYQGLGSFFVGGTISTANNAYLCVKLAGSECDFANANNSGSAGYWDATQSLLLLQAQAAFTGTNFHFQGGIYSDTSISLGGGGGGTAGTQGPLVSPHTITVGQQLNGSFPDFPFVTSGSLGTQTPLTLSTISGGTY